MNSPADGRRPSLVSNWQVAQKADPKDKSATELIMAWAKDSSTGEPCYIGELGPERRGASCGCVCVSCNLPLTAVNASKRTYKRRPHFRHPIGAEKDTCQVLAARVAALTVLQASGLLHLPQVRKSSKVAGLSGAYYDAWVERPAETVRIAGVMLRDATYAILKLDDGRELKVQLIGQLDHTGPASAEAASPIPTILLTVDDPHIASMSPEELRSRLQLIVDDGLWCSHWADEAIAEEARLAAQAMAANALDWSDDIEFPEDMPADLKRETLLHHLAKKILLQERRVHLPDLVLEAQGTPPTGAPIFRRRQVEGCIVEFDSVEQEQPLGNIRPDVTASILATETWPAGQLLIEITVTNPINDERIGRIAQANLPAIEIDLGCMGGFVTLIEFTKLIVEEKAGKRWLYHPLVLPGEAEMDAEIQAEIQAEIRNTPAPQQARELSQSRHEDRATTSVQDWSRHYLDAIVVCAGLRVKSESHHPDELKEAQDRVRSCAEGLAWHGYHEAQAPWLISGRGRLLERLLSIKLDQAIGCNLDTSWQVINTILTQDPPVAQRWKTIYLLGIRTYHPTLDQSQLEAVEKWSTRVQKSIAADETAYLRPTNYDRLLSLLFPEMAEALAKPFK